MDTPRKKVAIITINYNGAIDVIDCVQSLEKLSLKNIELCLYIVDNHSKKESFETIEQFLQKNKTKHFTIQLIKSEVNTGFTGGNNLAIRRALDEGYEYVVMLNNDTVVEPHLIEELVAGADEHPKAGIVAPKIYFAKGSEYHKDRYKKEELGNVIWYAGGKVDWANVIGTHVGVDEVDTGQFARSYSTESATGCCVLLKKETIEKVGFLDDAYFMYYEDADYSVRVKQHGLSILFWPKAILWHKNASSSGGSGSPLQEYYITRNRLLFGMKYASIRAKFALIRESWRVLSAGTLWQKKGVIDFFTGKFGKGSYGSI